MNDDQMNTGATPMGDTDGQQGGAMPGTDAPTPAPEGGDKEGDAPAAPASEEKPTE